MKQAVLLSAVLATSLAQAQLSVPDYADEADSFDEFGADVAAAGVSVVFSPFSGVRSDDNFFAFEQVGGSWQRSGQFQQLSQTFGGIAGNSASLSPDGNLLAIGHPFVSVLGNENSGAVTVYERGVDGWTQLAHVESVVPIAQGRFGGGRAIDDRWLIVGQPGNPQVSNTTDPGRAYVFERVGNNYVYRQELTAPDGVPRDRFGYYVDLSGDQLIVNARSHLNSDMQRGAEYVFELNGGTWQYAQTIATGAIAFRAIHGDVLATWLPPSATTLQLHRRTAGVWAVAEEGPTFPEPWNDLAVFDGAVPRVAATVISGGVDQIYLSEFRNDAWTTPVQISLPSQPQAGNASVALTDTHLFVGDPTRSFNRVSGQGVGYGFSLAGASPVLEKTFVHGNGLLGDLFGLSVDIDGDWVLATAQGRDELGDAGRVPDAGAVYMYRRQGQLDWVRQQALTPPQTLAAFDSFGSGGALGGDLAVVTSKSTVDGVPNIGRADVYLRDGLDWNWACELPLPVDRSVATQGFALPLLTDGEHVIARFNGGNFAWRVVGSACNLVGEISVSGVPNTSLFLATIATGRLLARNAQNGDWHVLDFDGMSWVRSGGFARSSSCGFEASAAFRSTTQVAIACGFPTRNLMAGTTPAARMLEETGGVWNQTQVIEIASTTLEARQISWGTGLVLGLAVGNLINEYRVFYEPDYTSTQALLAGDPDCTNTFANFHAASGTRFVVGCHEANTAAGRRSGKVYIFERVVTAKGAGAYGTPQNTLPPPPIRVIADSFESP
ncbi:FG-GAP repeat protein [Pseudomarimonas arenosa]|uniref:FG-GAP repeat protein n=1 Tax=Pseudomarimonas arenosa TaxID=2774145 RepID=A0AAW3ZJD0_9GAMM|nr:FG-GAP repeat protein [Pseudomarimonas arenosa]MBD8526096.1 hypothetical protein [Pseudomarimonas arenosa]